MLFGCCAFYKISVFNQFDPMSFIKCNKAINLVGSGTPVEANTLADDDHNNWCIRVHRCAYASHLYFTYENVCKNKYPKSHYTLGDKTRGGNHITNDIDTFVYAQCYNFCTRTHGTNANI